ncbi:uncharacterized protein LOC132734207 [Ruditapes philippinarum]|uniref:uncharacterized protein LOC132734207 n=1 Tax=Ruditapes philippinarum TaxID=129788 RepID=UPI00295A9F15|nr:uncharacterized protein LOC132734207 [Ruditapes philippinarum]
MDGRTRRRTPNDNGHDQQRSEYEDRSESKKPRLRNGETESQGRWSSGNVEHFLAFEPTEIPKWRLETRTTDAPTISEMLKDIVIYKGTYERLKGTSTEAKRKKIHRWLLVRFLCTIQKEEGIGVQEETLTESIMEDIDKEINGAMSTRVEQLLQNKSELLYQRHNSLELPSLDFDEIGNMHDKIQETGKTPTKSAKETINLYRAYKHIKDELKKSMDDMAEANTPKKEIDFFSVKHDSKGFIEVESLIKHTHRILMEDIMHEGTPPGNFSTYPRTAEFNGKTHEYPKFENVAVAEQAIQTLVDKVNEIIESIRQRKMFQMKKKQNCILNVQVCFCFVFFHYIHLEMETEDSPVYFPATIY